MENSYKRDDDDDIDSRGFLKFYFVKITCTKITIMINAVHSVVPSMYKSQF